MFVGWKYPKNMLFSFFFGFFLWQNVKSLFCNIITPPPGWFCAEGPAASECDRDAGSEGTGRHSFPHPWCKPHRQSGATRNRPRALHEEACRPRRRQQTAATGDPRHGPTRTGMTQCRVYVVSKTSVTSSESFSKFKSFFFGYFELYNIFLAIRFVFPGVTYAIFRLQRQHWCIIKDDMYRVKVSGDFFIWFWKRNHCVQRVYVRRYVLHLRFMKLDSDDDVKMSWSGLAHYRDDAADMFYG